MTSPDTLYWWHQRVLTELRRLRDECGMVAYPVVGLAQNLELGGERVLTIDVERWCEQLADEGLAVMDMPALWDYPGRWVGIPQDA